MSEMGQSRHFGRGLVISGLPPETDTSAAVERSHDGRGIMGGNFIFRWAIAAVLLGATVSTILGPPRPTAHFHLARAP